MSSMPNRARQILARLSRVGWIDENLALELTRMVGDKALETVRRNGKNNNVGPGDSIVKVAELHTGLVELIFLLQARLGDFEVVADDSVLLFLKRWARPWARSPVPMIATRTMFVGCY